MIAGGRGCKMPCESCAVQFSVFKRKRACCECERLYCSGCLRRGGGAMCAPCRVLSTRPLYRNTIAHLKVRDLQCFLHRQNVSTRGCVEKEELISLCVSHVNGAAYRRRGSRSSGAFSSLKGFTNNINDFLNSAFDLRTGPQSQAQPQPPPRPAPRPQGHPQPQPCQTRNCFNSSHNHGPMPPGAAASRHYNPLSERFTTTPGGERDIEVPVPSAEEEGGAGGGGPWVETADCFEIEDLDDSGWEFVTRPADPLPNDSDILLSTTDGTTHRQETNQHNPASPEQLRQPPEIRQPSDARQPANSRYSSESRQSMQSEFERIPDIQPRDVRPSISREYLTPGLSESDPGSGLHRARAASELELRSAASSPSPSPSASAPSDSASLNDELLDHNLDSSPATPRHVTLDQMKSPSELERLNVKQLKELLTRNRVEFRGCLERRDLLERAHMLWRDHNHYKDELDNLPIEECCKICMAAPLECVLLECGHIAACTACSKQLAECPICRQYVVRAIRFFRS